MKLTDPFLLNVTIALQDHPNITWRSDKARTIEKYVYSLVAVVPSNFIFQIAPMETYAMARFKSMSFASLSLTDNDKKDFDKWSSSADVVAIELIHKFLGEGFKISCSWVTDQNAFCFSVIGTEATKHHRDMVMTSWSDDLEEVISVAAYKHWVLCNGGEWPTQESGQRWG